MSSSEKCIPDYKGTYKCVFIGIFSFVTSTNLLGLSINGFFLEISAEHQVLPTINHRLLDVEVLGFKVNVLQSHAVLTVLIIVAALWMVASLLLIIGIFKDKPSLVLCYFVYGIIVTILCFLTALFIVIQSPGQRWRKSLAIFGFTFIHIHWLMVVHSVYELMQRGKDFGFQRQHDDEDPLADSEVKEEDA